ncbi:hypothetical protein [Fulvivirga lutea]|uniref:Uncharacterized protein n=1 Tax=Fulvivirga lutea TaxID=2810512 RepID=A0A974WFZ2_9BACT|nr:hypothetical protein [Fulvivirga lutea]QSE97799.1 hypothetical protein JR347_01540 [Fulvivirga lutea]
MDNILNRKGIKSYSQRFSTTIVNNLFSTKESIDGEQIKKATSISQVNSFVVKGLFEAWQKEIDNLKSPYFDYSSPKVQEALKSFMNVLSRNISVKKEAFTPLLEKAVEESILLIFSPFDYYEHLSDHYSGEITVENLKSIKKYVKVNNNILELIIEKMESSKGGESSYPSMLAEVLHEIESGPEEIDTYYDSFNEVEPLSETDIYGDISKPEPVKSVENEVKIEVKETKDTLNDTLATNETTIAEMHEQSSLESMASGLTINQRFMFQNALFNGDEELMKKTLDFIDQCSDRKQALDHIYQEFPHWNIEGEEFEEFVELINKRLG